MRNLDYSGNIQTLTRCAKGGLEQGEGDVQRCFSSARGLASDDPGEWWSNKKWEVRNTSRIRVQ